MLQVKCFTFNFIQENTYIVYDDQSLEAVIIDAGNQYPKENLTLFKFIEDQTLHVIRLLNTHTHLDHIMGNEACSLKYNLIPEIHPDDMQTFVQMIQTSMLWGVDLNSSPVPKANLIAGEEISIGSEKLKILFTPGHSLGHISFYSEACGFIISGDVIFAQSIGRTDLPGGDFDTLIHSIRTQIFTLPPETKIFSGHGEATSVGEEKAFNPYVN